MSVLVQSQMLTLALRVDPRDSTGTAFTSATIGVNDGDRFAKQRLLDIYNEARLIAANEIMTHWPKNARRVAISGTLTRNSTFQFTTGVATKPTDYVDAARLTDVNDNEITILPVEDEFYTKLFDTANNPLVYEESGSFRSLNAATYVPDASTYILIYYGITKWTLTNVTNGTTNETFNDILTPLLIDVAVMLAKGMGAAEVVNIAHQLISGGRK